MNTINLQSLNYVTIETESLLNISIQHIDLQNTQIVITVKHY